MSTPQNPNTAALAEAGVSIWLDDLSRTRLDEGTLEELIATRSVTGVTTNPSIFAVALADAGAYQGQLRELAAAGASVLGLLAISSDASRLWVRTQRLPTRVTGDTVG